jgi:hypothetical protein
MAFPGTSSPMRTDDVGRLDPLQVRRSAERFAPDRIAAGYEQAYRAAMQREPAGALS